MLKAIDTFTLSVCYLEIALRPFLSDDIPFSECSAKYGPQKRVSAGDQTRARVDPCYHCMKMIRFEY